MLDARALIEKHSAKGVLVDANLLVLLLVGLVNRQRIPEFKRTSNFTIRDFDLLKRLIKRLGKLISTPHVLSQVSDLTDLPGNERTKIRELFKLLVEQQVEEFYDRSTLLVADPIFMGHGLTDTAVATICARGTLVLTADIRLQQVLQHRNADALNFYHVRELYRTRPLTAGS